MASDGDLGVPAGKRVPGGEPPRSEHCSKQLEPPWAEASLAEDVESTKLFLRWPGPLGRVWKSRSAAIVSGCVPEIAGPDTAAGNASVYPAK